MCLLSVPQAVLFIGHYPVDFPGSRAVPPSLQGGRNGHDRHSRITHAFQQRLSDLIGPYRGTYRVVYRVLQPLLVI